jgi:hypothetical protein
MRPYTLAIIALGAFTQLGATQQVPAVRPLGPVVATSKETLGNAAFVRHLKDGVIVNDVQQRRLLKFDATLSTVTVIADTTPATASAYGGRVGNLIAYRGDSSLFVDPASTSMLVIDPQGKIQRVMSIPRPSDAMTLGNATFGTAAFDATGRLVYRGFNMPRPQMRPGANGGMDFQPPDIPDSTAILRIDLSTRALDTVAFVKIPKVKVDVQRDDNGRVSVSMQMNPLPIIDDYAVLADGSIALVRGRDYHVDIVRPDGSRESFAKIPFEWQRMTDEDKVAFMDSLKAARQRMIANAPATATGQAGAAAGGAAPAGAAPGEQRMTVVMGGPGGGGPPPGGGPMGGREPTFVAPSELPDYKPVFFAGAVRADADGFIWIRTIPTKGTAGGPVYDVINAKGELVDRVQVPKDRTIVGFGQGGIVYLLAREGTASRLERASSK